MNDNSGGDGTAEGGGGGGDDDDWGVMGNWPAHHNDDYIKISGSFQRH